MSTNGTSPQEIDPALLSPYHYVPSRTVAIIFIVLFGVSTCKQAYLRRERFEANSIVCLQWRTPLRPCAIACGGSSLQSAYVAPSRPQAGVGGCGANLCDDFGSYPVGCRELRHLEPHYPETGHILQSDPSTLDLISLVVQGTGGGLASTATSQEQTDQGGNVMLGGIVFQLVTISVYACLAIEFFVRYLKDKPFSPSRDDSDSESLKRDMTLKTKLMTAALAFSTICLFIRAVYRTIELADGWNGRIISTQLYFNVLDGAMVVLAIYTMNIVHPGVYLSPDAETSSSEKLSAKLQEV
ncbi:hypothetical protein DXG03_000767 [Asterophora parasitica]|uniref:Uncharacterized protein n=1 Tax=Asterophora parasitica TaxID=117018 RepID=A0A9P7GHP8_9AGAR|nr:hypothetical protein DXG03_000767 [Asterophora parasitica]